jgi:hypothetical protein
VNCIGSAATPQNNRRAFNDFSVIETRVTPGMP